MISTTTNKENKNSKKVHIKLWVICAWLLIWIIASLCVNSKILLPTPWEVLLALAKSLITISFYKAVCFSFSRILFGFLMAVLFGLIFAWLSYRNRRVREFIDLPLKVIKSIPVASFIILALVWIPSKNLSVFISFLISFPIIYTNIYQGLENTDKELLEMASVFRITQAKKIRYIYVPETIPFFRSAIDTAIGYAWKAGVAGEIIGLARGSIGEKLYEAKIYLETPELFAWTIVIIIVSSVTAKAVLWLSECLLKRLEGR